MAVIRAPFTTERIIKAGKRLFSFLLTIYLVFLVGRSVYTNFRVKQQLAQIEVEIKNLKSENQRLTNLIAYYQTETFRELEARSKLGLKKPGEIVIALPENADEPLKEKVDRTPKRDQGKASVPNYIKWWEYFFGE